LEPRVARGLGASARVILVAPEEAARAVASQVAPVAREVVAVSKKLLVYLIRPIPYMHPIQQRVTVDFFCNRSKI
jgi:hypothetical protein